MSDSTERNCNKCIHHTSGNCDSWDCKIQTVEDVKKEAVNEYVKAVVEELGKIKGLACDGKSCGECKYTSDCLEGEQSEKVAIDKAIEIVKAGVKE